VTVVVTTAPVPAHTVLSRELLATRQVSRDALGVLAADAVLRLDDAIGLVARVDLPAGEVVRKDPRQVVVLPEGADAAIARYRIPEGLRLDAVRLDAPGAVAGHLRPGDHVDVIYTAKPAGTGNPAYAQTVLQSIEVFSVTERGKSSTSAALPEVNGSVDVTLLVSPEQAQVLALAKRSGGSVDLSIAPPEPSAVPLAPTLLPALKQPDTEVAPRAGTAKGSGPGS
jgi:pilus assembly protein CpaB